MNESLLIYDDECSFCQKRAEKFKNNHDLAQIKLVGRSRAEQFLSPETMKKCDFEREIHLIEPDGSIYRGGAFLHRLFSTYAPKTLKNRFLGLSILKPILILGYNLVAKYRHLLSA